MCTRCWIFTCITWRCTIDTYSWYCAAHWYWYIVLVLLTCLTADAVAEVQGRDALGAVCGRCAEETVGWAGLAGAVDVGVFASWALLDLLTCLISSQHIITPTFRTIRQPNTLLTPSHTYLTHPISSNISIRTNINTISIHQIISSLANRTLSIWYTFWTIYRTFTTVCYICYVCTWWALLETFVSCCVVVETWLTCVAVEGCWGCGVRATAGAVCRAW